MRKRTNQRAIGRLLGCSLLLAIVLFGAAVVVWQLRTENWQPLAAVSTRLAPSPTLEPPTATPTLTPVPTETPTPTPSATPTRLPTLTPTPSPTPTETPMPTPTTSASVTVIVDEAQVLAAVQTVLANVGLAGLQNPAVRLDDGLATYTATALLLGQPLTVEVILEVTAVDGALQVAVVGASTNGQPLLPNVVEQLGAGIAQQFGRILQDTLGEVTIETVVVDDGVMTVTYRP